MSEEVDWWLTLKALLDDEITLADTRERWTRADMEDAILSWTHDRLVSIDMDTGPLTDDELRGFVFGLVHGSEFGYQVLSRDIMELIG